MRGNEPRRDPADAVDRGARASKEPTVRGGRVAGGTHLVDDVALRVDWIQPLPVRLAPTRRWWRRPQPWLPRAGQLICYLGTHASVYWLTADPTPREPDYQALCFATIRVDGRLDWEGCGAVAEPRVLDEEVSELLAVVRTGLERARGAVPLR